MRKSILSTTRRMLLALLAAVGAWTTAGADVTVWVQATSAPKLYVFNYSGSCSGTASGTDFSGYTSWSGATMTRSVTTGDNKTWYYEVFKGLTSSSIIFNDGNGNQTADITGVSGTSYFYYNGAKMYINLTKCAGANAYFFLETSTSYWQPYGTSYVVWDGSSDVTMTLVGGIKDGDNIYLYSSNNTPSSTVYIKEMENGSQKNEASAPYTKGSYYLNTGWQAVTRQAGSSLGTIVWPTIPVDKNYTLRVYDPAGAARVGGSTLTATHAGTYDVTWYEYSESGTSLSSSLTLADHSGSTTTTVTPTDGATDYYVFNGTSFTKLSAETDLDLRTRYLVTWPGSGSYASNKTSYALTTTGDNITYTTASPITMPSGKNYFVFNAGTVPAGWTTTNFYTCSSDTRVSDGSTGTAGKGNSAAYYVENAGQWTFTYNVLTNAWTAAFAQTYAYTIHVFDPDGAPAIGGTALTAETIGNVTGWYKYNYSSTTAPAAITITSHSGTLTQNVTPADGDELYYAFNGYSAQAVTSAYDGNPRKLVWWASGGSYAAGTEVAGTTTDGITYTYTVAGITAGSWALFTTKNTGAWNDDNKYFYGSSGNVTVSGLTASGTAAMGATGILNIGTAGQWTFTYNVLTNAWTAQTASNTYTIHVAEYNGGQPYLYAWYNNGSDVALTDAFPGTTLTATETLNGETWYTITLTTAASVSTISVTASLGAQDSQTADITGIAPGDYYIAFNGTTKATLYSSTTAPTTEQQAEKNTFTVYVRSTAGTAPYIFAWGGIESGGFPGTQMTTGETLADGNTWYKWTFTTPAESIQFLFTDGTGGDGHQSADLTLAQSVGYYIYNGTTTADWAYFHTVYVNNVQDADASPYVYIWNDGGNLNDGWPGKASATSETLDGVKYWRTTVSSKYDLINLVFNTGNTSTPKQTDDILQKVSVAYYTYDPGTIDSGSTASDHYAYTQQVNPSLFTGEMYLIGQADLNTTWAADTGIKMTADATGKVFTLNKVRILAGATLAFAARLGDRANDWYTIQPYRLTSTATGNGTYTVTSAMTTAGAPTALTLLPWLTEDNNFKMDKSGYYKVTVDLAAMTVKFEKTYDILYMYYGGSTASTWKPNAGVPMVTNDGNTYTLSGVTLADGDTFQFTKQLSATADDWNSIADYRYGANADGDSYLMTSALIGSECKSALLEKSQKNFVMDNGTAGNYRVVVNLANASVTLYEMATVLSSKTVIHLEQTDNVASPLLWAYDKEKTNTVPEQYNHENRPSRPDIATTRRVLAEGVAPVEASTVTTPDGRQWWTWTVNNSIADFWFTRGDYDYAAVKADALADDDMTDIQWRRAGELYFTWPNAGAALEDYTRDYYTSSAKEVPECATILTGRQYAYFVNTPGWNQVFAHVWYTDAQGNNHDLLTNQYTAAGATDYYPGAPCTLVGYDTDGYEVWLIDFTEAYNAAGITDEPVGVIFNNGIDNATDYATGTTTNTVKEQTGDFTYEAGSSYDYIGAIARGGALANIISGGEIDVEYVIDDDLAAIYYDQAGDALYCKDLGGFVNTAAVKRSVQKAGEVDYMKNVYDAITGVLPAALPDRYDQSNWVKLTKASTYLGSLEGYVARLDDDVTPKNLILKGGTVKAVLKDKTNPHMEVTEMPGVSSCTEWITYAPNVYTPMHFCTTGGEAVQTSPVDDVTYFFVTPKPQEYALITQCVYVASTGDFTVSTSTQYDASVADRYGVTDENDKVYYNPKDLNGSFPLNWDMQTEPDDMDRQGGQMFQFYAIVRLGSSSAASTPRRANTVKGKAEDSAVIYAVSPLNISTSSSSGSIITGVEQVSAAAQVESVTYVDITGRTASRPFPGVNIVVTRHTDGTTTTTRVIN